MSDTDVSDVADETHSDTDDQNDEVQDGELADDSAEKLAAAEAKADKYARALFEARVAATGRLADATDLPFNAELLDDADALTAAIDLLIETKPHLASRKPAWGDVGAGQTKAVSAGPTFADLFA
ncbi:hypothetical protein [Mycolicibacterium sp. J2]|uniref:hypothetical protein n=1 Tax=Mycolicibacterium sp. J2 TaxID=2993511 RepID=UPI00224B9C44|nr:hypothetical protein [Mycolicibacterium sp. J2]MCX2716084.1 hypothetical protein [Mycolicibacterium sp. J2]